MSWPGFHALSYAWLFALLIPLVILYFLKLKRPRVEVPSLALWRQVINDQRVNSPFQKFKRNILLLLQFLLLLAVTIAAMQPFIRGGPESYDNLPIVIDCSASMAALDRPGGRSRLDVAREEIGKTIDALAGNQRIALFSMTSTGRRLTELTDNKRILREALDRLEVSDVGGQLEDVMRMTLALSRTERISKVRVYSDGNVPETVDFELPFELDFQKIDTGGSNIGIIELNATRKKASSWTVFVRVAGSVGATVAGDVRLLQDGELLAEQNVLINDGESQRLSFTISANSRTRLEARLVPDSFDSLAADNAAWLELPESRPLRVYAGGDTSSWQHALSGIKEIQTDTSDVDSEAPTYDVVVSDDEADEQREANLRVFTGLIPRDLQGLLEIRRETETRVVDWQRTDPLLQHVQLGEVRVLDPPVRMNGVEDNELEEMGYQIVVWGDGGPLVVKRREGVRLTYYFLFHTEKSTLPYRIAFPILVANTITQALTGSDLSELWGQRTGVLDERAVNADRDYVVESPDGETRSIRSTNEGILSGIPAQRAGVYTVREDGDIIAATGASLLDARETSLTSLEEMRFREVSVNAATGTIRNDRPLWKYLALCGFALLLIEWWYFQRRPLGAPTS